MALSTTRLPTPTSLLIILALAGYAPATRADSPPAPLQIQVGIAAKGGRHTVIIQSGLWPREQPPGLAAAMATLLGCPVEPHYYFGFRCRDRMDPSGGLSHRGTLDLSALASLSGEPRRPIILSLLIPEGPALQVSAPLQRVGVDKSALIARRAEFRAILSPESPSLRLDYRTGFDNPSLLAAALCPIPLLLWWLARRPDHRWPWVAAVAVWCAFMGTTGALAADSYFWYVPSVEGAFLRWITWIPLLLLLVAQAYWMGGTRADRAALHPLVMFLLLRPRWANWMTTGETVLSEVASLALLALVAHPLLSKGRDRALLPDEFLVRLHDRLRCLARPDVGGFDLRLDQAPVASTASREPGSIQSRLGTLVTVPAEWLSRLRGRELEAAILLAVARTRYAPLGRMILGLSAIWVGLMMYVNHPVLMALGPVAALATYTLLERAWDRTVAQNAVGSLGESPAVLRAALAAIEPEWGDTSRRVTRQVERLAGEIADGRRVPPPS